MGIGASVFTIAIGAILFWGITASIAGISLNVIGIILMIVGAIGLIASMIAGSRADTPDRRATY